MVQPDAEVFETESCQNLTCSCTDLRFHDHRTRTQYIHVTLKELTEPAARWPVCAPHRLNLVSLEKLWQLVTIFSHHPGQGNCQVIAQCQISFASRFMNAAFEYFEDELVPFFAILAHQCLDVFDSRCFQWFEAVAFVHLFDHTDDVLPFADIVR